MQSKLSRYCEGIIEATWLAAVIIIPIYFNIYSSRIFEPDKIALFRSLALVALSAWFIKVISDGGIQLAGLGKRSDWFKTIWKVPMLVPVIGLALIYGIATIFSISPGVSLWGSYQRLQGTYTSFSYLIFFALVAGNLRKWTQVERLLSAIILASLPVALYGLLQRYGLDPIPWAGNTTVRVAANMGNSIFVAAYLIMVVPITIGRLVKALRNIGADESRRWLYSFQIVVHTFIACLQLITIYLSQSRGPVIGLLAGGYLMLLLLAFFTPKRWLRSVVIGAAVIGGGLLWGFNLVSGPLESLHSLPAIGRFGMLLDPDSTTALSRKYIWQGTAELVSIHPPLQFPDGETDAFNTLRPLIGYGPESMYVVFNQFYPPELGHVEKRNASPDRSHNETWDAMVTTGLSGLVVYLFLFGTAFYNGIKWLGFIASKKDARLMVLLLVGAGICGAAGFSLWRGIEYSGIGVPFGIMIGLLLYISIIQISNRNVDANHSRDRNGNLILIMLLSALLAHFIEINFGIAIVATRMLFWIYAGLLIVVGHVLPARDAPANQAVPLKNVDVTDYKNLRVKRAGFENKESGLKKKNIAQQPPLWMHEMFIAGLLTALILVTLGNNNITNASQSIRVIEILINSFTRLPSNEGVYSAGVFALSAITLLVSVILFSVESTSHNHKEVLKVGLGASAIAVGVGLIFSLIYAGKLAAIARNVPTNQYDVFTQTQDFGGMLTGFYLWIAAMVGLTAYFLVDRITNQKKSGTTLAIMAAPVFFLLSALLVHTTNLRVIQADMVFKVAEPFVQSNQWEMATLLYQRAIELAPMEDHYYLFLGRSYFEHAKDTQSVEERDSLILKAAAELRVAQAINPLNTDHTANLARLYNWWASQAPDEAALRERGGIASQYFATAVNLSPNNMVLWGEWAILNIQVLDQPQKAYELLSHAIEIDPGFSLTQGLMGDYYRMMADSTEDAQEKRLALEQAARYYQEAVGVHNKRDTSLKSSFLRYLASTYIALADVSAGAESSGYQWEAIRVLEAAMVSDLPKSDGWRVQETLAGLYASVGDRQTALKYANSALEGAAGSDISRIQDLIRSLQETP